MSEQFHPNMRNTKTPITLVGTTYGGRFYGATATDRAHLRVYFGRVWVDSGLTADGRWQRQRLENLGFQVIIRSARPGEAFTDEVVQ